MELVMTTLPPDGLVNPLLTLNPKIQTQVQSELQVNFSSSVLVIECISTSKASKRGPPSIHPKATLWKIQKIRTRDRAKIQQQNLLAKSQNKPQPNN